MSKKKTYQQIMSNVGPLQPYSIRNVSTGEEVSREELDEQLSFLMDFVHVQSNRVLTEELFELGEKVSAEYQGIRRKLLAKLE